MPQRSREAYLWDIADSCQAIVEFVARKEDQEQIGDRFERYSIAFL
jgi:uncharacterized protein with HEPN domain